MSEKVQVVVNKDSLYGLVEYDTALKRYRYLSRMRRFKSRLRNIWVFRTISMYRMTRCWTFPYKRSAHPTT